MSYSFGHYGFDARGAENVVGRQRRVLLLRNAGRLIPTKKQQLQAAVFVYGRNKSSIVISFCIKLY